MPGVDVYYKAGVMSYPTPDLIKSCVRKFGVEHFSTKDFCLSESDFSFKFHESNVHDELTHDIIVRIRLHDFPARRAALEDFDVVSADLAARLMNVIFMYVEYNCETIGVELMFTTIGWGASGASSVV